MEELRCRMVCKLWKNQNEEIPRRNHLRNLKNHQRKVREQVFNHYGWKCTCCGESNPGFLTIDHINNDGCKELGKDGKTRVKGGSAFYALIIKEGFPINLQTLCFQCNCGRGANRGICPHKASLFIPKFFRREED